MRACVCVWCKRPTLSLFLIYNDTPAKHADILTWSHTNREPRAQTVTRNAATVSPFPTIPSQNEGHPHGKCD